MASFSSLRAGSEAVVGPDPRGREHGPGDAARRFPRWERTVATARPGPKGARCGHRRERAGHREDGVPVAPRSGGHGRGRRRQPPRPRMGRPRRRAAPGPRVRTFPCPFTNMRCAPEHGRSSPHPGSSGPDPGPFSALSPPGTFTQQKSVRVTLGWPRTTARHRLRTRRGRGPKVSGSQTWPAGAEGGFRAAGQRAADGET